MRNLLFTAAFDGKSYHGFQIQNNAHTVQKELTDALFAVTGEHLTVTGCSRTDAGVHANEFCFNVKTESKIDTSVFPNALNANLPFTAAVYSCCEVPADFHARYSCTGKQYIYKIYNNPLRNPFFVDRALHYRYYLDAAVLNGEAKAFIGTHDFSAFCSAGCEVKSKIRSVSEAGVTRDGDVVTFSVTADGFLYNMVRIMVGTLLGVSEGKIPAGSIPSVIDSLERERAGITAPPEGLYLNKVYYGRDNYG